jgi:hypothetical protein
MFERALRPRVPALALLLSFALLVAADAGAPTSPKDPGPITVHEWGTVTSIAGADGQIGRPHV